MAKKNTENSPKRADKPEVRLITENRKANYIFDLLYTLLF